MRKLTSDEIKKTELDLLLWFDAFCREKHLRYYLCGGTLLGAIRHKGFIPWDDDIDVLMPRSDFEKLFAEEEKQDKDASIQFGSWRTGQNIYPFFKLYDMRTVIKERFSNENERSHVYIDIFPFDGMPSNDRKIKWTFRRVRLLRYMIVAATSEAGKGATKASAFAKRILVPIFRHINLKKACERVNTISRKIPISKAPFVGGYQWGYGPQEKMPRSFLKSVMVDFEGYRFPAPSCWDTYLSGLYGDYMKLPPEKDRVIHGFDAWRIDE